jgi:hypothetical protein
VPFNAEVNFAFNGIKIFTHTNGQLILQVLLTTYITYISRIYVAGSHCSRVKPLFYKSGEPIFACLI